MSTALLEAIEQAARLARAERRKADRPRKHAALVARVNAYLAENPGATANAVCAAVGGNRSEALAAVREARTAVLVAAEPVQE